MMRAVSTILIGANTLLVSRRTSPHSVEHPVSRRQGRGNPDDLPTHCLNNTREPFLVVGERTKLRLRHFRRIREPGASAGIALIVALQAGASAYLLTTTGIEPLLKSF
jgi:hypothetical protein